MKYCVLASGSRGNSLFIESGYSRILLDIGLSARKIEERLATIGVSPDSLDAIVLTHSHKDHVRGAGVFARRFGTPIYAHPQTLDQITYLLRGKEDVHPWREAFSIKDLTFRPFPLPHDSDPTFGYLIGENGKNLAVCTDLGVVTDRVRENLREAHAIVLESNHDPGMLMSGPYPWHLKERISSRLGHLSNSEAGELLREVLHASISRIILGHLSEENNTPEKALNTVFSLIPSSARELCTVIEQRKSSALYIL